MIKLVCALGNPGREYARTRHNSGWMILGALPFSLAFEKKFKGEYAGYFLTPGTRTLFLKPLTFMNKSGESLRACTDFFSIAPDEILVVHDDLELGFGAVQTKSGGGLGGHNGLKSIVQHTGTKDFKRLRFGIGRPAKGSVSSYVLSRFTHDEEIELERHIKSAADILLKEIT